MQSPEEAQALNDFSLEAIRNLFEPTAGSILWPESSRLNPPDHARSRSLCRNISTESASSYMTLVEDSPSFSPTSSYTPRLPNTHSQSPAVSNCSQSYKVHPRRRSPQYRKRANLEDEDHSEDLEPLDPNATDGEKKEYKRRQNTLAARRSRAKRALETQSLRDENMKLKTEIAIWKERAMMMKGILATHGLPCPSFST